MKKIAKCCTIALLILGTIFLFNAAHANSAMSAKSISLLTEDETKKLYDKNCAKCHGKDGRAKTFRSKFVHAQDFTDKTWRENTTNDQMTETIKTGRGKMPAFAKKLNDEQIKALIEYIRMFKK